MKQNVVVKVSKNKNGTSSFHWASVDPCNPTRTKKDEIVLLEEDIKNLEEEIKDLNKVVSICNRKRKELKELKDLLKLLVESEE